jgi:predicted nucleotidyltransferase
MLSRETLFALLKENLAYFQNRYGVKQLGVFGSYAKGLQKENSDIDVLVEFETPPGLQFIAFSEDLEQKLGQKTDILTLVGIETIRLPEIAQDIRNSVVYINAD